MEKKKWMPILWSGLAVLTLIVSVTVYLIKEREWSWYTLFFPVHNSKIVRTEGEVRRLPKHHDPGKAVRVVVEELLLGPADIQHDRIVPENTDINIFILSHHVLYIDFAKKLILSESGAPLPVKEKLEIIEKTIHFNFKKVKKIVFTINGQIPFIDRT